MTRSTNMEHVEVLERLRGVLEHGKMGDKCLIAPDLVTAAIASLSAPQSTACVGCEGKPTPENTPCAVCGQQPAAVDEEAVDWHVAEGQCIASVEIALDGEPIVICYGRDHPTGRYVLTAQQGGE